MAKPYHSYGYREGQWSYAYNFLSKSDRPGEWHLDRAQAVLYFWSPSPLDSGQAMVSLAPALVATQNVSHVILQGFILEGASGVSLPSKARGAAVTISGGTEVTLAGCVICDCGGRAVAVHGGKHHRIMSCDIYETGDGCSSL